MDEHKPPFDTSPFHLVHPLDLLKNKKDGEVVMINKEDLLFFTKICKIFV